MKYASTIASQRLDIRRHLRHERHGTEGLANSMAKLGLYYRKSAGPYILGKDSDFDQAYYWYSKSYNLYSDLGWPNSCANFLNNFSVFIRHSSDTELVNAADWMFRKCIEIYKSKNQSTLFERVNHAALMVTNHYNFKEANEILNEAISSSDKDESNGFATMWKARLVLITDKDWDKAETLLLDITHPDNGNSLWKDTRIECYRLLSEIYLDTGRDHKSEHFAQMAVDLAESMGAINWYIAHCYLQLGEVFRMRSNPQAEVLIKHATYLKNECALTRIQPLNPPVNELQ